MVSLLEMRGVEPGGLQLTEDHHASSGDHEGDETPSPTSPTCAASSAGLSGRAYQSNLESFQLFVGDLAKDMNDVRTHAERLYWQNSLAHLCGVDFLLWGSVALYLCDGVVPIHSALFAFLSLVSDITFDASVPGLLRRCFLVPCTSSTDGREKRPPLFFSAHQHFMPAAAAPHTQDAFIIVLLPVKT